MELVSCVEPESLRSARDVDRILVDSRLLYAYMRERKDGREYVDFTYKRFHAELLQFEVSLGGEATFSQHIDVEYDKRSIPEYLLVSLVDAGVYLMKYHHEFAVSMVSLTKRLSAELREANERIRTLEANQLAADTLREHWGAIEQRFDDYTQMSIKVQKTRPSKHLDELRYQFDLCYSAVKGVMRNAIAMTNTLPTKGETPCQTK